MNRLTAINRALLTVVLVASWTVTTSHCALAAATSAIATAKTVTGPGAPADACPMHAATPAGKPVPEKKKGCSDLPCCKNLPAAKPMVGISVCKPPFVFAAMHPVGTAEQFAFRHARQPVLLLDTGPPAPDHFVGLVLQRSIPAHAPPVC